MRECDMTYFKSQGLSSLLPRLTALKFITQRNSFFFSRQSSSDVTRNDGLV